MKKATRIAAELEARGRVVQIVDGDEFRRALSKGLTFSREDRDENVRRIGFVARLLAKNGACAITAAISPFREVREEQRSKSEHFIEVYCRASLDALVARDPKGLYAKALAGEIQQFTGVDDPYEEPLAPEVLVETDRETVDESVARILAELEARGLTAAGPEDPLSPPWGITGEPLPTSEPAAARDGDPLGDTARLALETILASGLLAPIARAMDDKDALKVERTGRLESGKAFPFVVRGPLHVTPSGLAAKLRAELRENAARRGPACGFVLLRDWHRAHQHLANIGLEVTGRLWLLVSDVAAPSLPSALVKRENVRVRHIPYVDPSLMTTARAFALTQIVIARNVGFGEILLDVPEHLEDAGRGIRQGRDFLRDLTDTEIGLRILAAGPVYEGEGLALGTARTLGA